MQKEEFIRLLTKVSEGRASDEELALYLEWYRQFPEPEAVWAEDDFKQELLQRINYNIDQPEKVVRLWPRIRIAVGVAAAVATVVFGVWFFNAGRHSVDSSSRTAGRDLLNDVAPGKNGATITLANGQVIALSGEKKGVIVGAALKYADGTEVGSPATGSTMLTASTARGQMYEFILPDGTKVWLNADSKISFPSQFNGKERKILLSGEAYFAVVHNAKQPFRVESRGQVVEDIGTEFNINAYADNSVVKTTLVEGSAKVNETLLKPNQQAVLTDGKFQIKEVDPESAVAWKNGLFIFDAEPLESIMKRVERWYNVEVVYQDVDRMELYGGSVSRYDNISRLLEKLELTGGIHFKIEGRTVTVMK